jgi:hypothetical protein
MNRRAVEKLIRAWKLDRHMSHDIKIMYSFNSCGELILYTPLPGWLIGKGGVLFEKYKKRLLDAGIRDVSIVEMAYKII